MIECTFFHRALGIPDDVIKPTYYQLLDLDPESCTPELVKEHLNRQRIRLRQSIRGTEFIPMILWFEKQKLNHAASVLRDPARKSKYDLYLARKAEEQKRQEKRYKAREERAKKIRELLDRYLNPDKTLNDANRPLLATALDELGVKEEEIAEFLDRIPAPAKPTSKPSNETIKYFAKFVDLAIRGNMAIADAKEWTMGMAHTLGIPASQAHRIFDGILEKRGVSAPPAPKQEDESGPYKLAEPIEQPEPVLPAEPLSVGSDVPESNDEFNMLSRLGSLRRIAPVVVPIVAIGIFGLLVWCFHGSSKPPEPAAPSPAVQRRPQTRPPVVKETVPVQMREPNDSSQGDTQPDEQQTAKDLRPETIEKPEALITPEQLKKSFASAASHEEILTDVAFTMSLCCARAIQFNSQSIPSDALFQSALTLTPAERQTTLTRNINIGDWTPDVSRMKGKNESKKPGDLSIMALVELDTPEAAEELLTRLSALKSTGSKGIIQMEQTARIIYALTQMHDSNIPVKLVEMIEKSSSPKDYLIVRALINASRSSVPNEAMLPLKSEDWERRECADWWRLNVPSWGRPQIVTRSPRSRLSGRGRITSPPPTSPPQIRRKTKAELWQPNPDMLKLLAVITHFANKTAGALAQDGRQDSEALLKDLLNPPNIELAEPNGVPADLLSSLQNVRVSVRSLIRAERADDIMASAKERQQWIRNSASTTVLQEIVVEMDAIADFIGLTIEKTAARDAVKTDLEDILRKRAEALGRARTVIEQLRESCYYNFVLWHRLLELRLAGPVPDSPGR